MLSADRIKEYLATGIPELTKFLISAGIAALTFFIGCKIINALARFFIERIKKSGADTETLMFISSITRVVLKVFLAIVLLGQLGVKDAMIIAALGSVGVGLGLALQGGMANFAGGLLIIILKPFTVGDYIIEVSEKNEGTVKKIDMFYTTLVTVDNRKIVIPNKQLTDASIINVTSTGKRMLILSVGISYDADLAKVRTLLNEICMNEPRILKDSGISVCVEELAASSVNLGIRVWTSSDSYMQVKWDLNEAIKKEFDANGILIAYNQMDIHLFQNRPVIGEGKSGKEE